jgi:glutathione S-transferase
LKLYSAGLSPFAARARLAIYAKGLNVEILSPPAAGTKSPEYLAVNPMGKVPAFVTDDGTVIPESDTIVEYLDDAFPTPPLRPASAEDKAKARLLARIGELYLMPAGGGLFNQVNPATRDQAVVDAAFEKVDEALTHLNVFMGAGPYAVGETLTTADCSLAPAMFFMGVFGQVFGRPDLLAKHGKVAAYAAHLRTNPHVQKLYGEMQTDLQARMAAG